MKDDTICKITGFVCATVICCFALIVDGIDAIRLSIGVAAAIAGITGYYTGVARRNNVR